MKILHVSCSPRGRAAESYLLSQKIIGHLREVEPAAIVVDRAIGDDGLLPVDRNYAMALSTVSQVSGDISGEGSMTQSEKLIAELEASDVLVIATPMHNYTIPAGLKTWIDHVVRVRRTFHVTPAGKVGALRDLPVFVAVSSGGRYSADRHSGGRARQPDFLTPYLTTVLATIGLHDVTFFSVEGTAYGPEALASARIAADERLEAYFSSFTLNRSGGRMAQAAT